MSTPTKNVPKRLVDSVQLGTSSSTLYTSPAGQKGTRITAIVLVNTGTSSTTATLYLVKSGDSDANSNMLVNAITIPADGFPVVLDFDGVIMNAGDFIDGLAGVTNQITVHIFGIEMN